MKTINVGLIGCGSFAKGMHIPILKRNPKFRIYAVMDINEAAARDTAADTGAAYWTTDLDRLLSDKEVEAVFIMTRHDTHSLLSVKAANAGKHILCEKPMGLNRQECKDVAEAVIRNKVKYTVGYNRGISPMITKAKELIKDLSGKKMVYHRIQANFNENHWIHIPEVGGGRFIGEGCHIFDLICELVDKTPVMVYASGGTYLNQEKVKTSDSGIVTITFEDGSIGTTLINSAGCPDFPKEATEIYCNNKAIFINDFTRMECYGFENHKKTIMEFDSVDKGHWVEIDKFADSILNDTESPNGLTNATRAAVISYMVNLSIEKSMPVSIKASDYNLI